MNKPLKFLLLAVVVLILVVPIIIMSQASTLIRDAVEDYGPDLLGAPVSLGSVSFSLINGEVGLDNLVIGNPPGFKSSYAFNLKQLRIKLDPLSLFSKRIDIQEIMIEQPDLIWEIRKGGSNFQVLQRNLPVDDSFGTDDAGPMVMIDHVYLNGTRVEIQGLPVKRDTALTLPDLHVENIGRDEGGVTFGNAVEEIFGAIMPAITKLALSGQFQGLSADTVEDLKDEGRAAIEGLKGKAEDKLKRRLGGLLGGKDKDGEEGEN